MVSTTLKELRKAGACKDRYAHLKKALGRNYGDNTPIDLCKILETNGLEDVLWIPESAITGDHIQRRYRLFAVACCQNILHLMDDQRSRDAVRVAHLYAYGEVTDEELIAASDAAWAATRAAASDAAWDAAWAAAWAAARAAAWAAAWAAASDAASDAAWDAAWAAARDAARAAARAAAWDAARAAAWDAARAKFTEYFKIIFSADF